MSKNLKPNDLVPGDIVEDTWFPHWGSGIVKTVLKTRVYIVFGSDTKKYDAAHVQFLRKLS